ncbi:arrestin domain-containing protein 17-like, partial [Ctenocephalides felis]|uniref:arrestin domain-containing protein 17-like n=1 Tax=Ctenocephalides felis TaxID=7515 RepID=UPI000E6E1BC8
MFGNYCWMQQKNTELPFLKTGAEVELPYGKHTFNFMCALPALLPCSYEGGTGFVRYTIKVTLDRPWKFDQTSKAAFTVISALDLNMDPRYRLPVMMESSKTFWCGCTSGPLFVSVQLPQSGYAPGQEIPVACNISNDSRVNVEFVQIKITKIAKFHSRHPHKIKQKSSDLVTVTAEGVPKFNKISITKNFKSQYKQSTKITVCDSKYWRLPQIFAHFMPLTIGTVPIIDRYEQSNIGFTSIAPSAPPITTQPGSSAQYDDL